MPNDGFIKLYRSMTAWEWYDDPNTKSVFLDMLLEANHKDGSWHGVKIKRGQVVVGRKKLAKKLGISEQSIRTCINRLKSTNEITTTPTNKFSIVTIINYEKYQSYDNKPTNKNNNTLTNNQPAINQQSTTNKNDKNDKNISIPIKRGFIPPTLKEITSYCQSRKNNVDPKAFLDYFTESGWIDSNGNRVKNWKSKIITWESYARGSPKKQDYDQRTYSAEYFEQDRMKSIQEMDEWYNAQEKDENGDVI